jgi:hypothetical protein
MWRRIDGRSGEELELVRLEERAWRRVGGLTPLRKVMASRHGIWLAHGCAEAIDDGEVEEDLDVANRRQLGPVENGGDFVGIHLDAFGRDEIAEILDLVLMEGTFLRLGEESGSAGLERDLVVV